MTTHYLVYKITNRINGKVYIGTHKTDDLADGYMGSGKYLNHAIKKHGVENFEKMILHDFDNPTEMFAKEAELVNEDFLANENTYNLRVGGFGGFDYVNNVYGSDRRIKHSREMNEVRKRKFKEDPLFREKTMKNLRKGSVVGANVIRKVSDNQLLAALNSSNSIRSALIKCGLSPNSPNGYIRARKLLSS